MDTTVAVVTVTERAVPHLKQLADDADGYRLPRVVYRGFG